MSQSICQQINDLKLLPVNRNASLNGAKPLHTEQANHFFRHVKESVDKTDADARALLLVTRKYDGHRVHILFDPSGIIIVQYPMSKKELPEVSYLLNQQRDCFPQFMFSGFVIVAELTGYVRYAPGSLFVLDPINEVGYCGVPTILKMLKTIRLCPKGVIKNCEPPVSFVLHCFGIHKFANGHTTFAGYQIIDPKHELKILKIVTEKCSYTQAVEFKEYQMDSSGNIYSPDGTIFPNYSDFVAHLHALTKLSGNEGFIVHCNSNVRSGVDRFSSPIEGYDDGHPKAQRDRCKLKVKPEINVNALCNVTMEDGYPLLHMSCWTYRGSTRKLVNVGTIYPAPEFLKPECDEDLVLYHLLSIRATWIDFRVKTLIGIKAPWQSSSVGSTSDVSRDLLPSVSVIEDAATDHFWNVRNEMYKLHRIKNALASEDCEFFKELPPRFT